MSNCFTFVRELCQAILILPISVAQFMSVGATKFNYGAKLELLSPIEIC